MAKKITETPKTYPILGRWMNWVDRPGMTVGFSTFL